MKRQPERAPVGKIQRQQVQEALENDEESKLEESEGLMMAGD